MLVIFLFAAVLLLAVLLSGLAARSVLSTAVLFLGAGFVAGRGALGWIPLGPGDHLVSRFAELALFSILFVDGIHLGASDRLRHWRLPGRALVVGMPFTVILVALLARWVAGLDWADAWLLGAALSPTDPVFAAALIGNDAVPARLRHLLNVESGLNDGLAVPFVVAALGYHGAGGASAWSAVAEATLGVALGVAVAWLGVKASRAFTLFDVAEDHVSIGAFAVALLVLSAATLVHGNEFLAAFAAGVTASRLSGRVMPAFDPLGRPIAEILKLAALLLFGALLTVDMFASVGWRGYAFAVLTILVARPLSIVVAMLGARLSRRETLVAGWFGPRGFASVFFALLILHSGIRNAGGVFALLACVVVLSIVAHSSTDVLVARRFGTQAPGGRQSERNDRSTSRASR